MNQPTHALTIHRSMLINSSTFEYKCNDDKLQFKYINTNVATFDDSICNSLMKDKMIIFNDNSVHIVDYTSNNIWEKIDLVQKIQNLGDHPCAWLTINNCIIMFVPYSGRSVILAYDTKRNVMKKYEEINFLPINMEEVKSGKCHGGNYEIITMHFFKNNIIICSKKIKGKMQDSYVMKERDVRTFVINIDTLLMTQIDKEIICTCNSKYLVVKNMNMKYELYDITKHIVLLTLDGNFFGWKKDKLECRLVEEINGRLNFSSVGEIDSNNIVFKHKNDECCICFSKLVLRYVLIPCGHNNYCKDCVEKLQHNICAICRQRYENKYQLF
jgi:hypothetical protein